MHHLSYYTVESKTIDEHSGKYRNKNRCEKIEKES